MPRAFAEGGDLRRNVIHPRVTVDDVLRAAVDVTGVRIEILKNEDKIEPKRAHPFERTLAMGLAAMLVDRPYSDTAAVFNRSKKMLTYSKRALSKELAQSPDRYALFEACRWKAWQNALDRIRPKWMKTYE